MSSANTLLAIIDQLLDYAKWGTADVAGGAVGGAALAHAPLRLCNVLDEVVDVLGGRAAAAGVRLVVEATARAARAAVRGDAPRLRQVVVNLVDNALKHTPRGGAVTLTADVRAAPRRGALIRRLRRR
jgi:signal transduction histidine kinase